MTSPVTPKVVFFGDSITAGQYVDEQVSWTSVVSREWDGPHCQFLVRAVSGETTRQALERFPNDVQSERPHVVVIQFGLNDCNCWESDHGLPRVSIEAYRANLVEMVRRARGFGVQVLILATSHPTLRQGPMASGETFESARRRYNAAMRDVAAETGTHLCDIEVEFEAQRGKLDDFLLPAPDVLHLSAAGHGAYAAHMAAALRRVLASTTPSLVV